AQRDLDIRGPGELLGTKQTGMMSFRIADLLRDQHLIPDIQKLARYLHQHYPQHSQAIIDRWLAHSTDYSNA
ncbi:MAG: ATP-dependent DNA helicase RecG, partial [Plesiomonas sp.]